MKNFYAGLKAQEFLLKGITTLLLGAGAVIIMISFLYMFSTSLKDASQVRQDALSMIPRRPVMVLVNGKDEPLYQVTVNDESREMVPTCHRPLTGLFLCLHCEDTADHELRWWNTYGIKLPGLPKPIGVNTSKPGKVYLIYAERDYLAHREQIRAFQAWAQRRPDKTYAVLLKDSLDSAQMAAVRNGTVS